MDRAGGGEERSRDEPTATVTAEAGGAVADAATVTADGAAAPRLAPAAPARGAPASLPAALPDSIAERYESLGLLGRGGMGAVYRARDRQLGREVALKLLFDDGGGERLLREARAQARVEHEHACKIYEVGVEGGTGYIAMQYIAGEPLDRAAAEMTVEQKVRALRQVSLALHEAHRLGLVHRDVKPSNILVARGEDGAYHPYLTDFGIAREAGAQGHTMTGAIAGTPAFMAPEQARGEIRALDRRTDVYGLGATAYAVLAGRPPYDGAEPWALIQKILVEDAPALRRVVPAVPADLEAIVARCLEKDPGRRYASARALADDLQRFLDGDAVEARRLSPGYVLWRRARRHRGWLALAGAALLAALAVAALWIRDRQQAARRAELAREQAARRAELARELGQAAKEMEVIMFRGYVLPPHDIDRERELARQRLPQVKARMDTAGPEGVGAGQYALGRGYLALQEPEQARKELEAAREAGFESPELHYALGLALSALYDRALVQAQRGVRNPKQLEAHVAKLDTQYAAPAREHLRAALAAPLDTPLDAPAYVEGLIELREGRPEQALQKAAAAFAQAPWLYEAKLLEGDAHFALGRRFGHDAQFDYEKMMEHFRPASAAYRGAADIARSDPRVYEAACRLWTQIMNAAIKRPKDAAIKRPEDAATKQPETLESSHARAAAACDDAIAVSPRSVSARIERAFVESSYATLLATHGGIAGPRPAIDAAITYAAEVTRLAPGELMAPYVVGRSWTAQADYLNNSGADGRAALDRVISAYRDALRIDPNFVWALNDLAGAYSRRALMEMLRGGDPTASLDQALEHSSHSATLDPNAINALANQAVAYLLRAEYLAGAGRDPAPDLARTRAAIDASRRLGVDWPHATYLDAYTCWIEATHALEAGQDPADALARGEAIARAATRAPQAASNLHDVHGKLVAARARSLLEAGQDPTAALDAARASFQRALEAKNWDADVIAWRARVEVLAMRWDARQGEVAPERVAKAAAPVLTLLATPLVDPRPAQVVAELHAVRAASLVARGRPAADDIAAGLAKAGDALALNPRLPAALAVRGELLLARARSTREPRARQEAARAAADALSAAVRENPLLARRLADALAAARALAADPAPPPAGAAVH